MMEFTSQQNSFRFCYKIEKNFMGLFFRQTLLILYGEDLKYTAIYCTLRMGHLPLNISKSFQNCACGKTETAVHLLLDCKFTQSYRNILVCNIQSILTNSNTNVKLNVSNKKNNNSNSYSED